MGKARASRLSRFRTERMPSSTQHRSIFFKASCVTGASIPGDSWAASSLNVALRERLSGVSLNGVDQDVGCFAGC